MIALSIHASLLLLCGTCAYPLKLLQYSSRVGHSHIPYGGKYLWGPNFVLFILSLSERKFNTRNVRYNGVFSYVKWTERKLNTRIS